MKILRRNFFVFVIVAFFAAQADALIISGTAPIDPIYLRNCPEGSIAVAQLKSSVGWWEGPPFGGGENHILYRGDADALNEALTNFAAIKSTNLDLAIRIGPKNDQFVVPKIGEEGKPDSRVDWEFVVWVPESWNNLYNSTNTALIKIFKDSPVSSNLGKPVPAPQLIVYLGGGQIDWDKIKIPANVRVNDERAKNK
jgi:hypothetical protein